MALHETFTQKLPGDIRNTSRFFILYRPDASIPAVQVQLENGQTYDIYMKDFDANPQITRLPMWDALFRMACTEGQSAYIFGKVESEDSIESARMEPKKDEAITVTSRLREDALSFTGKKGRARSSPNKRTWNYSTF